MTHEIDKYVIAWNHNTGRGVLGLTFKDGVGPKKIELKSAEEVAAAAAILNESPAYYRDEGYISTGPEIPGG